MEGTEWLCVKNNQKAIKYLNSYKKTSNSAGD